MRVFVTGARGLLGAAITREFQRDADVRALDRQHLDVSDEAAVVAAVSAARPDIVVNCAAYNDVDGAQSDARTALLVNAFGVLALSRAARAAGAVFVHFSSDFVFDGETDRPYTEEDAPRPRGVYASSKLLGDWFALESPSAYVLRVESLFGEPGPGGARRGSLGTIVERIRNGDEVPVFVDRTVSPGYTHDIAAAVRMLIQRRATPGLYHCVNDGAVSWADIAEEAARLIGRPLRMKPISLQTIQLASPRPRYSALSNARLLALGYRMPTWQDALRRFLTTATA